MTISLADQMQVIVSQSPDTWGNMADQVMVGHKMPVERLGNLSGLERYYEALRLTARPHTRHPERYQQFVRTTAQELMREAP